MEIKEEKLFSSLPYFTVTLHNSFLLNHSTCLLLSKPSSIYFINTASLGWLFLQLFHRHLCSFVHMCNFFSETSAFILLLQCHSMVSKKSQPKSPNLAARQNGIHANFYLLCTNSALKEQEIIYIVVTMNYMMMY